MLDDNLVRALLSGGAQVPSTKAKKRSLDLHYESGNFQAFYRVPTYLEVMAKIKKFVSVGDRKLIERQRAINLHHSQIDTKELNRLALAEAKSRYLDPAKPFK
jgi:hypothetical protein